MGLELPHWIPDEPEHLREWLVELVHLRNKSVWKLRDRPLSIPRLVETALLACPAASPHSQYELMRALFNEHLVPALDEADQKLVDPYFNLTGRQIGTPKERRQKIAKEVFQQSWTDFRKRQIGAEPPLLLRLATALHAIALRVGARSKAESVATPLPYIERKELEEEFTELLGIGGGLIVIEGDAGNGKSRLAREVTGRHGRKVRTVRPHEYLVPATAKSDTERLVQILYRIAASDDKPALLVLDDVVDVGVVSAVPADLPFTLVVTTRQAVHNLTRRIRVGPMTAEEAARMIRSQLPDVTDKDAARLAAATGNKPLAIEHACALLRENPGLSVAELCKTCETHAAQVFDVPVVDAASAKKLSAIYRETYKYLEFASLQAAELLKFTSLAGCEDIPSGVLEQSLARSLDLSDEQANFAHIVFTRACDILEQLHLVQRRVDTVRINRLTQAIYYDLLREQTPAHRQVMRKAVSEEHKALRMQRVHIDELEPSKERLEQDIDNSVASLQPMLIDLHLNQ